MLPELKDVLSQALDKQGVHKMAFENSFPETAIKNIFSENGHTAGVWECGPGKYKLERKTDEFFVLLWGSRKIHNLMTIVLVVKQLQIIFRNQLFECLGFVVFKRREVTIELVATVKDRTDCTSMTS